MEGTQLFESEAGSLPQRLARQSRSRRPIVAGAAVGAAGYLTMTVLLVSLGLLLTKLLIEGPMGRWDASINRWLFDHRTATFDELTEWGSRIGDTATVVGIAAVAVAILAIGRHWSHVAFLIGALLIEVTTFVTTTFLIDRERPTVPQMDEAPPTSSFPSGHAAASIILYVGLALVTTSLVRNRIVRALVWILAVALPVAVALSRLYRGMHHPTDVISSVIGAAGCMAFALLATRTGVAVAEANGQARTAGSPAAPAVPVDEPNVGAAT
jgi:membrane-associated phospholipid phosphatase